MTTEEDEIFEHESLNDIKRLTSTPSSENSYSSLYGKSFFGGSDDAEREAHTEIELQRLNKESQPSTLKFKSRSFMFPDEKVEVRIKSKESEKVKKQKFRKVHFKETAVFYCYSADKQSYVNYAEWIRYCEIHLLTGHYFKHFVKEFIDDVAQTVVSDPEASLQYWKKIMRQGSPELFTLENLDGPLHHISVMGSDKAGCLPLLPDIREDMLLDPAFSKRRKRKKKKSSLKSKSGYLDDLTKSYETKEGAESQSSDDSVPKNVYLQLHQRQEIPFERRQQIKERSDVTALKKLEVSFRKDFYDIFGARLQTKKITEREETDLLVLSAFANDMMPDRKDVDLFRNSIFCKLFVRCITMKNMLFTYSEGKFLKYFRKIFASPTLNPADKAYNKDSYTRGKRNLRNMLKVLDEISELFQQAENEIRRNSESKEAYSGTGVSTLCEWENFGKIVVHKPGEDVCYDFFSGSEFIVDKPSNILESKLKIKRVLSQGKKIKKKKKTELKDKVKELPKKGRVLPPPLIHLPGYFAKYHEFLKDPLRYWNFLKVKWVEIYISVINTGITVAVLNDNLHLLRWVENLQYPRIVSETSMLASEPLFYTGRARNKESQRTKELYKVIRKNAISGTTSNLVGEYHHKYSYILTGGNDNKNPLAIRGQSLEVSVDSLSVLLNPIVRADLFYSRKRHACDYKCAGHTGMLLATAIRMGSLSVVEHLISRGLKLNTKLCSGDAETLRWDLSLDARIKALEKRQMEKRKRIGGQMSKSLIMSARHLLAPTKTTKKKGKKVESVVESSDSQPESSTMLADEVSMKGKKLTKEQTLQRQKYEEKEKIMKLKSVRDLVSETESSELSNTIALDVTYMNDSKKSTLVSTFKKQTPLTVAVICAVDDIYQGKQAYSKKDFRKLPAHIQTEKEDIVEASIMDIEQRYELVENFLNGGATVLDCEAAALRACLPVICSIAKAVKTSRRKKLKDQRLKVAQASHTNNMTLTARDIKNLKKLEKKAKKGKRFSVAELIPKKAPTSTEALNLKTFEIEAQRKYMKASKKCEFEKRRRYAAALSGFKTLNKITQQAVIELNSTRKRNVKQKFGGYYAAIIIRVILTHEAVNREAWDAVRFLCPYQVDEAKSMELEEIYPEADVYENSCKNISPMSAEVLKQTIKMLLKDLKQTLSVSNVRAWNGIFFILREYNITLSNSTMTDMMSCLGLCFTQTLLLKAGDFPAIERILTLRQVQTFLGLKTHQYFQERVLDAFALTKQKEGNMLMKKLKGFFGRKDFNIDAFRESLFVYTTAESMTAVSDSLLPTFVENAKARTLRALIFHCLVKKQNPSLYRSLEHICRQTAVEKKVYRTYFQDALACCMKDGRSSRVTSIEADVVLQLLKNKVKPKNVNDCFNFLVRSLTVPLFDLEDNYDGSDRCADLSRYFALNELFDFLFYQDNVLDHDSAKELFLAVLKTIHACAKDGAVWLQGVDHFIHKFRSLHDMHYEARDSDSPLAAMIKILKKRMKWDMNYSFEKKMLVMSYIEVDKEYTSIPYDEQNTRVLDKSDGEYISQIV